MEVSKQKLQELTDNAFRVLVREDGAYVLDMLNAPKGLYEEYLEDGAAHIIVVNESKL